MSFTVSNGVLETKRTTLTGNTATEIFKATSRTTVVSVVVAPNSGTPTVTLDVYDGTNAFVIAKTLATTNGNAIFSEPVMLGPGQSIRATSSDASGHLDCHVSYLQPTSAASR